MSAELSRVERIIIASRYYGLYLVGFAINDMERVDEDCCMDNMRVPRLRSQLSQQQIEYLTMFGDKEKSDV